MPASKDMSKRVDEWLIAVLQEGDSRVCLKENGPLPVQFQRCGSSVCAPERETIQYRGILRRLQELAGVDRLSSECETRGAFILTMADCMHGIRVTFGPGGSWMTMDISRDVPKRRRVVVPSSIWSNVQPWRGEYLELYDVRLKDGSVQKNILVDSRGVVEGQRHDRGEYRGIHPVEFDSADILAIRPRTGSLVAELGWARWITGELRGHP